MAGRRERHCAGDDHDYYDKDDNHYDYYQDDYDYAAEVHLDDADAGIRSAKLHRDGRHEVQHVQGVRQQRLLRQQLRRCAGKDGQRDVRSAGGCRYLQLLRMPGRRERHCAGHDHDYYDKDYNHYDYYQDD